MLAAGKICIASRQSIFLTFLMESSSKHRLTASSPSVDLVDFSSSLEHVELSGSIVDDALAVESSVRSSSGMDAAILPSATTIGAIQNCILSIGS